MMGEEEFEEVFGDTFDVDKFQLRQNRQDALRYALDHVREFKATSSGKPITLDLHITGALEVAYKIESWLNRPFENPKDGNVK